MLQKMAQTPPGKKLSINYVDRIDTAEDAEVVLVTSVSVCLSVYLCPSSLIQAEFGDRISEPEQKQTKFISSLQGQHDHCPCSAGGRETSHCIHCTCPLLIPQLELTHHIPKATQNWIIGDKLVKGDQLTRSLRDYGIDGNGTTGKVTLFLLCTLTSREQSIFICGCRCSSM